MATALGGAATQADAMIFNATLQQVLTYSNNSTAGSAGDISSSTATWSYDSVTQRLAQTGGLYNIRLNSSPNSTLYRTSLTGLVLGNGQEATASTFTCTEGNFGSNVGASICGNYSLGANFLNDSTSSWGPGTTVSRTLGGDDAALGPPLGVAQFDGFVTTSLTLIPLPTAAVLTNRTCAGSCVTLPAGAFNNGQKWTVHLTLASPPAAEDDAVTVGTGVPTFLDVLSNDYTGFASPIYTDLVVPPDQGGTVQEISQSPGQYPGEPDWFLYTSAPGFSGVETFTYRVSGVYEDTAVVRITVVDAISNPDGDNDGVADLVDNCTLVANASQCDSDFDGYGNWCDGDLNNNGATNAQDSSQLRFRLGNVSIPPLYDRADINCNGAVNAQDTTLLRQLLGTPPGPSSRVP